MNGKPIFRITHKLFQDLGVFSKNQSALQGEVQY